MARREYPVQANLYGLPVAIVKECILGVFEAVRQQQEQADRQSPRDYEEWIRQVFGEGIAKHLMIPYAEKM